MSRPPVLECRDVVAGYAGVGSPKVVLTGLQLVVPEEGRVVFLGRSGSGKSTLLRLFNRLEEPLSGTVLFRGKPLGEQDPLALRRRVALVLQRPVVFDGTVRDNLATRPRGTRAPEDQLLTALLSEVGLEPSFLDRRADALSVGEQQRMCLARALVAEPDVLLLDEPTSALDPQSLGVVADLVLGLAERRQMAVVAATHQADLLRRLGGTVVLLADGRARADVADTDVRAFFGAA